MLQKILVILIGLVMSLVGALAPSGSLFASHPAPDAGLSLSAGAHDETLATVRAADGTAFAKVSVLWVEVDGQRVADDAWGTGTVQELRFKVGTKDVDGLALDVGDKVIAIHPTDVLTVRMFSGEFAYRGLGSPAATIALQGTVKTTLVSQGAATNRILTEANPAPVVKDPQPATGSLAYVVLDTGQHVDTVSVDSSGQRFFTEETAAAAASPAQPGNLLARYVKIDGKMVRDYTSGDGSVGSIEFQPAAAATRTGVVAFNGAPATVDASAKVLVQDFVGEYLVYPVADGLVRVRLDGYAANYTTGDAALLASAATGVVSGTNAAFDLEPAAPRTADTITFHDRSSSDGYIVFRQWDFGDGQTSVLTDPTHRYALPGVYEVKLNVTDDGLRQREVVIPVTVRNTDPVPAFEFAPRSIDTQTLVAFTDRSDDIDGQVVNWSWDFGDGTHAFAQNPTHQFANAGNLTVTLTVTDNLGGRQSLQRLLVVRDLPPLPNFRVDPAAPETLLPVTFVDQSADKDGTVVAWSWSFGDGDTGSGSAPSHVYKHPGTYPVVLTATDNNGVAATMTQQVVVANRPPVADFTWTPQGGPVDIAVTFTSTSYDPDGFQNKPLLTTWTFDDGGQPVLGTSATHTFASPGLHNVTVQVTDGLATTSLTRTVSIARSAPITSIWISRNPAFRGTAVGFGDSTIDVDGDAIVSRTWSLGDNATSNDRFPNHTYMQLGDYPISLAVTDSAGMTGYANTTLHIVNRPPIAAIQFSPQFPIAGQDVAFTGIGTDPDGPVGETLHYQWTFSDGRSVPSLPNITRNFTAGTQIVTLVVTDAEGGVSLPAVMQLTVSLAPPRPAFDWSPTLPNAGAPVQFTDRSTSFNGAITQWSWSFGDGNAASAAQNPTHTYPSGGVYVVRLRVTDASGQQSDFTAQNVTINGPPVAAFEVATSTLAPGTTIQFVDQSHDPENETLTHAWSFGDGGTSTAANPTHIYATPGIQTVTLTVADPHGATSTTSRTISIADRPPSAGFVVSPAAPAAGQLVSFEGQGYSHDPDGDQTITNYSWSFGDGRSADGHNPTHTYANSGFYDVALVVSDGIMTSPPASQTLRVGADHAVTVRISATLPGERPAMLNDSHYLLNVTFQTRGSNPVAFAKGDLSASGNAYDLVLGAGTWLAGDTVTVSIFDDRWMHMPVLNTLVLADADGRTGAVALPFRLSVPLHTTLAADPGDGYLNVSGTGLEPLVPNGTEGPHHEPVYRDMLERFHGTGTVFYADGPAAQGASVIVEARYLPLELVAAVRDAPAPVGGGPLVPDNPALGWCRADTTPIVDAQGGYSWSFQGSSCLASAAGVFPAGVWQVRAIASYSFATSGVSSTQTLLVDPTGGLLWATPLGSPP